MARLTDVRFIVGVGCFVGACFGVVDFDVAFSLLAC